MAIDREMRGIMIRALSGLAIGLSALPAAPVLADPDDKKEMDRKPPVIAQVFRGPDAWKSSTPHLPVAAGPDATFNTRNINLRSWIPLNNFAGFTAATSKTGADVWGYTSPSGREYALMGLGWGIGVVEVTDPANPQIRTVINSPQSLWKDVTVIGEYAYAVSDSTGSGIQVIDLRQIDSGIATLVRNYAQGGHTTTHTILSNPDSGYLYLCGGNAVARGGMVPASVNADPTLPTFTGPGWTTQYVHEAFIRTFNSGPWAGREIAFLFAAGPRNGTAYVNGMFIVDVTNKAAPQQLSGIAYPGMEFCHQGWLTDDNKYLYINDELDDPTTGNGRVPRYLGRVFDVQDLTRPRLVSTWSNGLPSQDHNQYVVGRYMYQSNYTTGFRVFDMSDPLRPHEIAFIDTRPEDDATTFNGAWGNYPYFSSGSILISDLERGLLVVSLSLVEMTGPTTPAAVAPSVATPVSVSAKSLGNIGVQSVDLMLSIDGGAYTPIAMTQGTGDTWNGSIPAQACNARVSYYFRATAPDARTFTWPLRAPSEVLTTVAMDSQQSIFTDNFNTDQGWTVQNTSVTSGAWVRATPIVTTNPGSPIGDADGSGFAFVTGNSATTDVAGGPTRLLSPVLDLASQPEARVTFSRWLVSVQSVTDALITEVSNNNGATWVTVESLSPVSGGWRERTFRVADFVAPTSQVRVRFSISDTDNSTTEAGVDAFRVWSPFCQPIVQPCYANCDGSTVVPVLNALDFSCFLGRYVAGESYANCDGSTSAPTLNALDFACYLNRYAAGCP